MGVNEQSWYRKDPLVMNKKLADAIVDALPFDIDYKTAKIVLQTIFDSIVEGVVRDGFVTIEGLGRFYKHVRPATRRGWAKPTGGRKGHSKLGLYSVRKYPAKTILMFYGCKSLRKSLDEK